MIRPCTACKGDGGSCPRCLGSGQDTARIIGEFMAENPAFSSVEWDEVHEDLTVWFKDNPKDPCSIGEFVRYTPTWLLLEKLIGDLEECHVEEDLDD